MKKQIITAGFVLFALVTHAQQPPAPPKPPSVEERLKRTNEVLQKEVQPTTVQKAAIETAYKKFFADADKLRKDNPPPPPPPNPKMKEAMDKLVKERDEKVKKVLTAAQFEKYKEAAKKLQPPGPGGPSGKNGTPPQH